MNSFRMARVAPEERPHHPPAIAFTSGGRGEDMERIDLGQFSDAYETYDVWLDFGPREGPVSLVLARSAPCTSCLLTMVGYCTWSTEVGRTQAETV